MFANPLFLVGILAAGIPVLIHLIYKRRHTAIDLPTLMFLRRVEMKLASRRRLKEILLLALRAAALIFLAIALARPGFRTNSGGSASADCVFIVDNSASMGLKSATGTRLDAARAYANSVLATLGSEGRAAVLTTVPSEAVLQVSSLTSEREKIGKALQALQPTSGSGTLIGTLSRAGELLEQSSTAPNREIYIISDFQKSGFKDDEALRNAAASLPARTSLFYCPVPGGAPESNLSLIGVSSDPRPKVVGRRMSLIAKVKNNSKRELASTLTVVLNNAPQQQVPLALQPGASQDIALGVNLGQEGFASGEVRLDKDDALYDNVWPFCVNVRGPVRVLVLSPGQERREEMEESFYLRKALDPTGDGRLSGIRVTHAVQQSAPTDLAGFDIVVICGVTVLPAPAQAALTAFLERGGGIMIFAGRHDATVKNHPLQKFFGGVISGEINVIKEPTSLGLRAVQPAAPFFEDSRTPDGRVEFKDVAIFKALKVEADSSSTILAEYSDGHPALLVHPSGKGRVLWWTLSPNGDDSNLPLMPSFLSMLHCSVSVLCNAQSQAIECKAGQPLTLDLSHGDAKAALPATVTIFDPEQKSYEVALKDGRISWPNTARAGIYRIQSKSAAPANALARQEGPSIPPGFAVVPDPAECEPEYLSSAEVSRAFAYGNSYTLPTGTDAMTAISATRHGREMFGIFLFLALLMVLAEAMLANMLGTSTKKPSAAPPAKPAPAPSRESGLNLEPVVQPPKIPATAEATAGERR